MGPRQPIRSLFRWLVRELSSRRTRVFALAVVVTVAFLILPTWNTWNLYRHSGELSGQELRLRHLVTTVVHLDEVLTMSARMAAATGDTRWEKRYRRYEPELDAAIQETIRLAAGAYGAAAERASAANRALVAMESQSFALARVGRGAEAMEILFSDAYERNKREYAEAMGVLTTVIDERMRKAIQRSERRVIGAGALTVLGAGMLLLAWVGVVALIWRHLAQRERAERDRKYLEAQIQHMQKLESLGVMAGGIAHDFNNLLMPILGNVDLALADLSPDSPTVGRLQRVRDAGRRLSELSHQLLAYSGKATSAVRALDLSRLIKDMVHLLEISISKKAELEFDLSDDLPAIDGDSSQLGQVVMNLVSNASEALGDESGTIAVRTGIVQADRAYLSGTHAFDEAPEGAYVYVEVSDSGCGMDVGTERQIFDPFYSTKFTGRGLGLAVVFGIVRGHRGAIRVESAPGEGTRFRILFPCSERVAEPVATDRASAEPWCATGIVLVVDDEPDVREIAEEMLRRIGFDVLTAEDGNEGVETFRKHASEIGLVLLDLTMPGLSGEETLRRIRHIRREQRVVLMSGYSEEFAASLLAGRTAQFLQKPFTPDALSKALRATLLEAA